MYSFGCRILSMLLLGHLIAGVNREISNIHAAEDLHRHGTFSREAAKIMNFHIKKSQTPEFKSINDDLHASPSRRKRSTILPLCHPNDSCRKRCGEQAKDFPFTCNCDPLCTQFADCCFDYDQHCEPKPANTFSEHQLMNIPRLKCELLFRQFNMLIVNTCPDNYYDTLGKKLCSSELSKDCTFPSNFNASDVALVLAKCKDSVHRSCMNRLQLRCNVIVETQCKSAIAKQCSKLAHSKCQTCDKSFWPAFGENGIVYRNSFCALCNSQRKYTILSPYDLNVKLKLIDNSNASEASLDYLTRPCVPVDVDSCPKLGKDHELQALCHDYSGSVIEVQKGVIYKNKHCAICNGVKIEDLKCVTKASIMRGLIRPLLENFITGDGQGMKLDDIPAAFSILLNFGLDGRERMYFSSEGEEEMKRQQERCGTGRIWDPFSAVCRKLYCSTEFVLVDYQCIRKEAPDEEPSSRNEASIIPDAAVEFVHLTLSAEVEMFDFLQFHGQDIDSICETIRVSLSSSFNINIDRLRDVRFNISVGDFKGLNETLQFIEEMTDFHPIKFQIDFDLYEDSSINVTAPEPSVNSIVSMLASSLSMNGFEFDINNVTSRIFEIHQTVTPLTTWCNPESGGQKTEYWNSEFSLVLDENNSSSRSTQIQGIYVNKTGKFYSRGSFIADILFQGYQFSGSLINVSGVAVVCDWKSRLNESCIRILLDAEEYTIYDNGSLYIHNSSLRNVVDDSIYDFAENNTLMVCMVKSLKTVGKFDLHRMDMAVMQATVSRVLLWVSVAAMALVLITYTAFRSLRNLPGCNTMNLTFSLMMMQITFLFGQRGTVKDTPCVVVAHLLHYEILCSFMWMNVMAFDLFRTFGNREILSSIRSKSRYLPLYMIYAYLAPMIIILTTSLLDYFWYGSDFSPRYGMNNACWITNQYAAITFFAVPLAVIMLVNFIFLLMTILAMRSVKNMSDLNDQKVHRKGRNDVFLYARMALVIGLTWALSFAAASVRPEKIAGQVLTYLFIIFNTLQGVFIFCVFVCNKRVHELYKEALRNAFHKVSRRAKHESSSQVLSRLKDAMTRSVSTNTVVSTLSNASSSSNDSQLPALPE